MADPDVLVVGAGVAGLAAGLRLSAAGRRVVTIEARDRIGGRVQTVRPPDTNQAIELGAEFIHGHSAGLWPLIREAGLSTEPVAERHVGLREGKATPFHDVRGTLEALLDAENADLGDRPLAEAIVEAGMNGVDPASLTAVVSYIEGFHAADARRIGIQSLRENEAAEDADGEEVFRIPAGYDTVSGWLRDRCPRDRLDLRLSTPLVSLAWRPGAVTATVGNPDGTAGEIRAERAVITLPIGVLKAPAGGPAGMRLDPGPPGWTDALRSIEMGAAHRIVLRFEEAWWARGDEPISFAHGPASAFPVWWASAPGDEPRLTGWCGGPRAFSLAGRTPAVLVQAAFDSLAVIFGAHARNEAARLKGVYYHDWVTDPYSLGAYSYGGVGGREARAFLAEPVSDTLYLAGEAMAPDGRNATVHGAIASGVHAAELLLNG